MNELTALDALCVPLMVKDSPVSFRFSGKDYLATCGARDTMKSLTEGGWHHDMDVTLLVEIAQFGSDTRPNEKQKIELCVDSDGIPCAVEEVANRVAMKIQKIGRSGGGLSYELKTDTRG